MKHMSIPLLFLMMLTACQPASAPTPAPEDNGSLQPIRLPLGYIPNVQFAPVYVALEKGYFDQQGIAIEFDYALETDATALVGAGELQFAVVSADQVLLARAQGLPVVYVMAWYQQYPVSVVAQADSGIQAVEDLRGRRIGLPGLYGTSYIGLRALLHVAGLQESDVTLDSISYNQVEALAAGQEEAVVVYTANEPVQLAAQGYDLTEFRVADYVQLAANGLITNEATIRDHPELVQAMVTAMLAGIRDAGNDPEEAYAICKRYVENLDQADQAVQQQVLQRSIELWQAERPGFSQPQAWENMQAVLIEMGILTGPLDLAAAYSNRFIP